MVYGLTGINGVAPYMGSDDGWMGAWVGSTDATLVKIGERGGYQSRDVVEGYNSGEVGPRQIEVVRPTYKLGNSRSHVNCMIR